MNIHERVPYRPLPERERLVWPNGARLAVWIGLNVEWWIPDVPAASINSGTVSLKPDVLNGAWREYGARVGFWNVIRLFDRLSLPCSILLNANVCDHYPQIVSACVERNYEFLGHGLTNSVLHTGMEEPEERRQIKEVYERILAATGQAPKGWLGPALTQTYVTNDLLAEEGFTYVADWCNDDQPYYMNTRSGKPFLSVPYSIEVNDYTVFLGWNHSGAQFGEMIRDQFDQLYAHSAETGLVMCIALHPFLIGQPHRLKHLEQALKYMQQFDGVWWTTGGEIASWYMEQYPAKAAG